MMIRDEVCWSHASDGTATLAYAYLPTRRRGAYCMSMAVVIDTNRKHWTAADLREIPDDRNRYEIIDGELFVTPAPSLWHQELSASFFLAIRPYLEAHGIGNIVYAPADVVLADDTVVEPDLFVFPPIKGKLPARWEGAAGLLLAIEVLSPGTARVDRTVPPFHILPLPAMF
jgi:Uma2 family endonuclease